MIWRKQLDPSLKWIATFLKYAPERLSRSWSYEELHGGGESLTITLDASPYGLGGTLQIGGLIVAWFSSPLTKHDARIHRRRIGSSTGQQVWEALAYLVALRIWQDFWADRRLRVAIHSDNLSTLFMEAQMRSKAPPLVSKEVALYTLSPPSSPGSFSTCLGLRT